MFLIFYLINWFAVTNANQDKPVLQEVTLPKKIIENQDIKLNCDLLRGLKPVQFSWYFNDEVLKENDKLQITIREDSSSLMIKELSVDNNGHFKCLAANGYGSDYQKVSVYVNSKLFKLDSIKMNKQY